MKLADIFRQVNQFSRVFLDWVINYFKEQTVTTKMETPICVDRGHTLFSLCHWAVTARKQDSGRTKEHYHLLLTMCHSDRWNMSHWSANTGTHTAPQIWSNNLQFLCFSVLKKYELLFTKHTVLMSTATPTLSAVIIQICCRWLHCNKAKMQLNPLWP